MAGRKTDKQSATTSQLLNYAPNSYLERTSRPIYAVVFLLPFVAFYEVGTLLINTDVLNQSQIRVVAFVWLQDLLRSAGAGNRAAWVAPPLAVIVILGFLQLTSRKPWYFCLGDYLPMAIECVLLAVPLIVFSLFFNSPVVGRSDAGAPDSNHLSAPVRLVIGQQAVAPAAPSVGPSPAGAPAGAANERSLMANIVTGVGAGIYEELVFRLILIIALMMLFQDVVGLNHSNAIVLSVLISAALFSAHHHIVLVDGQLGRTAPFNWTEFGFRTIAGVYFAILFTVRGFGITAGTHALYDIIATIVNAIFFSQSPALSGAAFFQGPG